MRRSIRVLAVTAALACLAVLSPGTAVAQAAPTRTTQVLPGFDGTDLYTTFFLPAGATADRPVPLVLRTHGWAGSGETQPGGTVSKLLEAGYAVLTWDSRGFGRSGGEVQVDSPEFEARDASALIDWAAERPEIARNGPGDPIVGFTGGSYAGGIQLVTAAFDDRVDAIAPEIPWVDLRYSLSPGNVIKTGWAELLYGAGNTALTGGLDPLSPAGIETGRYGRELDQNHAEGNAMGEPTQAANDYFGFRSLAVYGVEHPVDVPTLVMEGSVDTLFNLNEGSAIYEHVKATGAPAKFIAFCGGHVSCPGNYAPLDDRAHLDQAILTWFDRYLRGNTRTDTGAPVEYRTNEGVWREATSFDRPGQPATGAVTGSASGTVSSTLVPTDGGSPITATPSRAGPGTLTKEIAHATGGPLEIVGIPTADLAVGGTGPGMHLYIKLIDREAGVVLNLQETALRVENLSATAQEFELDLVGLAYTLPEGHHLDLQIASTSSQSAPFRGPAQATVAIDVAVPVRQLEVARVAQDDRVGTSVAISQAARGSAETVVIARADVYPDALAGGPLAAALDAPVLLTSPNALSDATGAEVERLGATRAILLGGRSALTDDVENSLRSLGISAIERFAGENRYDTARLIAARVGGPEAYLTQGASSDPNRGWTDAVAVSALAARQRRPILLTNTDELATPTARAIGEQQFQKVTVIGGTAAVSERVVGQVLGTGTLTSRIAGANRYETSRKVAEAAGEAGANPSQTWVATGLDWPDALTAGPAAAEVNAVMLLVDGRSLDSSPPAREYFATNRDEIERVVLVGGEQAISRQVSDAITAILQAA